MRSYLPTGSSGWSAQEVAVEAAKMAGQIIRSGYSKTKQLSYKGRRDIVTDADMAAEKAIMDIIRREFPDHSILAEESGATAQAGDYQWIVDPLDGTLNYSQSIPIFCTSIALAHRGEVLLGLIHDPLRRESFCAMRGGGATLNGKRLSVSGKSDLGDFVVAFDLGYDEAKRKRAVEQAQILLPVARTLRLVGSAALALAYVAAGRLDAFYHHWLSPWDLAAGVLLISEAGGKVTDWDGRPAALDTRALLASNGTLHDQIKELLKE